MSLNCRVFLEVKRLIQAAQLIVDVTSCTCDRAGPSDGSDLELSVEDGSITLSRACGCVRCIDLQCDVMVNGCSAVRWVDGDGLHLRLPVTRLPVKLAYDDVLSAREGCDMVLVCAQCTSTITRRDGCTITRVLPLPSSNWSAAAEQWFCPCKPNRPAMHHGNFVPQREGDCLQGDDCWIVRFRSVEQTKIDQSEVEDGVSSKISCITCNSHLGTALISSKKGNPESDTGNAESDAGDSAGCEDESCASFLRGHVLCLAAKHVDEDKKITCACFLEDCLSELLLEASQDSGCSKFLLQSYCSQSPASLEDRDATDNVARLWLMSTCADVLSVDTWTDCTSPSPADKQQQQQQQQQQQCALRCSLHPKHEHFQQGLKVLYKPCTKDNGEEEALWLADGSSGTQSMSLTRYLADRLLAHLNSSNAVLPPSLRHFDGYKVGYLFRLSKQEDSKQDDSKQEDSSRPTLTNS
ncbi:E3 ubiquitin-protein ligase E3D-like [Sycon ciliatum]|uniref:E3 ubiquitin-protein ligase E3D-like n=1 Tax=Sycon ciliatum TaxID=27933 RepID=UPI0031F6581B